MGTDRKRNGPQICADFVTRIDAYKASEIENQRKSALESAGIGGLFQAYLVKPELKNINSKQFT